MSEGFLKAALKEGVLRQDTPKLHEFSGKPEDGKASWRRWELQLKGLVGSYSDRAIKEAMNKALALFASYQPYWFGGLIVAHILVSIIVNCLLLCKSGWLNNVSDIMDFLFMNLLSSIGMIVNMFLCQFSVDFPVFFVILVFNVYRKHNNYFSLVPMERWLWTLFPQNGPDFRHCCVRIVAYHKMCSLLFLQIERTKDKHFKMEIFY